MDKSPSLFYLIGLICGKGYILDESVSVNFPHHKKIVEEQTMFLLIEAKLKKLQAEAHN